MSPAQAGLECKRRRDLAWIEATWAAATLGNRALSILLAVYAYWGRGAPGVSYADFAYPIAWGARAVDWLR